MKVIILAAGQGTRLRPFTDTMPKCMVKICGKSIIERQIETLKYCDVKEEDIYIIAGYKDEVLKRHLAGYNLHFIQNTEYERTNMVYSMMQARSVLESETSIIVAYGDIVYTKDTLQEIIDAKNTISVVVDDGWQSYWEKRFEDPLKDAETLVYDGHDNILEIGQKTKDIKKIQSQYIGLMKYCNHGLIDMLSLCAEADRRSVNGLKLWRTDRNYKQMYMTDMLQGLIDEGNQIKAIHINRGWYEVDCVKDLKIVEEEITD